MPPSRKHDAHGRRTGVFAGRVGKLHRPPGPFVWLTVEMMSSPAFRALSITSRRVLDRLCCEHLAHGGCANGFLRCTYLDFIAFRCSRELIPAALRELEQFGWVRYRRGGRWGETKEPSQYTLTWVPVGTTPATNEWKSVREDTVKNWKADVRARKKARAWRAK
jgi:hypothetical protein